MKNNRGGAYVHIPFCRAKCAYCGFYSMCASAQTIHEYVLRLVRQIRSDKPGFVLDTAYIGGGTPSLLEPEDLGAVCEALWEIGLQPGAEFTVEVNPESVTDAFLETAKRGGVNRISMGVQSFDDAELRQLGRLADTETCLRAVERIRKHGFENLSIDLMLAIPGQSDASLMQTLRRTVELRPEHLSAYLLKVEDGTPFARAGICEQDEEVQRRRYLDTSAFLSEHGYEHYEISNFARPGFRARHNSSYWQGKPYAAYGCGAHGYDGVRRWYYAEDAEAFLRTGKARKITEQVLTEEDRHQERILLGLRTSDGIRTTDIAPEKRFLLPLLAERGLLRFTTDGFALTPEGFLVSDTVILQLW